MKACFGYIRVSTQKQGEGASLSAQKDAIEAFAVRSDLKVVQWFEEKETAAKSGRPVFNKMLKDLKRGRAQGLIMHKIDRSARNLRDWAIVTELPDAGIDVFIATETLDFRSRGGRLTADIQAVIAADYIRNLREETIKGLTGRLKQGLYPFRAPIGYLDAGRGKPKTVCPVKGPLVHEAFQLYASGEHSFRSLELEMTKRGLRNHRGQPVTLHGIETILKNPFYCGLIEIKRTGATYTGIHERLIAATTFKRVQDIRAGKSGKKVTRHNHLYRGVFRCGLCDRPMSPELQKGTVYYRCQEPLCRTKTIREDHLDTIIQSKLTSLKFSAADELKLRQSWLKWIEKGERTSLLNSIDVRGATANEKLNRLTDALIDRLIDKPEYERRKKVLLLELSELGDERKRASLNELCGADMEKFIELMKNLTQLHISAKPAEKRTMVQNLFSNRTVVATTVELEPHNWLKNRDFSDLSPLVTHIDTLIEKMPPSLLNSPPSQSPQLMFNLKH